MTCHEFRQSFDDYLDNELAAGTRDRIDRHLSVCADCREEMMELRSVLEATGKLEREIAPSRDLWPGIEARLGTDRSTRHSWWPQLVAAGIALVVLSVPISVWWTGRGEQPIQAAIDNSTQTPSIADQAELARSEDGVLLPRTDLVTAIERRRDVVEADTFLVLEENMILLDRAIGEIRTALEEDPQNLRLRMLLAARYQQERKLLQKVSRV